jgi:hypothetical protein
VPGVDRNSFAKVMTQLAMDNMGLGKKGGSKL